MNQIIRKSAMAVAVSLALGASVQALATSTIMFDRDGGGGTAPIAVDTFNWQGDSILMQNLVKSTTTVTKGVGTETVDFTSFTLLMQSALGTFVAAGVNNVGVNCSPDGGGGSSCGTVAGSAFTFTLTVPLTVTQHTKTNNSTEIDWAGGLTPDGSLIVGSMFNIYYNPTPAQNQLAGTGFNSGTLILSGSVVNDASTNGSFTLNEDKTKLFTLDGSGVDNYPGIGTYSGNGNASFDVAVNSQDLTFFKSNLIGTIVPIATVIQSAGGPQTPFTNVNPSAQVNGSLPNYGLNTGEDKVTGGFKDGGGKTVNSTRQMDDLHCGVTQVAGKDVAGTTSCDAQAQGQGQTSFSPVPEPGSLALLGLGFGILGYLGSRRRNLRAV